MFISTLVLVRLETVCQIVYSCYLLLFASTQFYRDSGVSEPFIIDPHHPLKGRVLGNVYEQPRLMKRLETADEVIEKVCLV